MTRLMGSFERASTALRHSKLFERSRGLWNLARPVYNVVLSMGARGGLVRNMNQSDLIRIHPAWRSIPESYEPLVWSALMSSLRSGDCVVEVGGFIGLYSVAIARRIQPFGVVYTFEPD